jgi:phosphoribosylformylglycinamidine cyclo-ligase
VLKVFKLMQQIGNVPEPEMYRTFNMGVGMVIFTSPENKTSVQSHLEQQGMPVYEIGRVIEGRGEVVLQ